MWLTPPKATLEYELAGDLSKARDAHHMLLKTAPSSRFVPFVHFSFGEMFFAEGASDAKKNALAAHAYGEVLKFAPPLNPLHADALFRLAQTHERMGDDAKAKTLRDELHRLFLDSDAAKRPTTSDVPP